MDLSYNITHIHAQLDLDVVEALGLDGSGRDHRRPHTWASLTDNERARAMALQQEQGAQVADPEAPDTAGITAAAQGLTDALYRLDREWQDLFDNIDDPDLQDAVRRALEEGFPLGKALEVASGEAAIWVDRLAALARNMPSVLALVAAELADDVDKVVAEAKKKDPDCNVDEWFQNWQNGGLGGVVGRVGGVFTPAVISALAALMQEIHLTGTGRIRQAAAEFAHVYRAARRLSRS